MYKLATIYRHNIGIFSKHMVVGHGLVNDSAIDLVLLAAIALGCRLDLRLSVEYRRERTRTAVCHGLGSSQFWRYLTLR